MQEVDAERRLQILRGRSGRDGQPSISNGAVEGNDSQQGSREEEDRYHREPRGERERKSRKKKEENDTDRDIRHAKNMLVRAPSAAQTVTIGKEIPLIDQAGHINLFPTRGAPKGALKNREAENDAARKEKEYEDQYTLRFSNAAGFKQDVGQKPWYQQSTGLREMDAQVANKDVWGNEDPQRMERSKMRIIADDPLKIMKRGVRQLREVTKDRKTWDEDRKRELDDLGGTDSTKRKRRGSFTSDDLEEFHLDGNNAHRKRKIDDKECKSRHRHRGRDRIENGHSSRINKKSPTQGDEAVAKLT